VTDGEKAADRLAHVLQASRMVLYSCEPHGDLATTFVSENVTDVLGYNPEELTSDSTFWGKRVHPDDLPRVKPAMDQLFERGSNAWEYRFLRSDGAYRWMREDARLLRDAGGAPLEIVGTWQDVTDRREAEELIQRQASALNELSTPLIPVSDQVLVMPLVGTLDTARVKQIMIALLEGVSRARASAAILDITGVTVVDSQVANALIQAAKAVRLLGAEVVLTGIRPEVARTLVGLGVDLEGIVTRSTLQGGIEHAMGQSPER
jgi:rsbT co-antagonist protein RsbR